MARDADSRPLRCPSDVLMLPSRAIGFVLMTTLVGACGFVIGLDAPRGKTLPRLPDAKPDPCLHVFTPDPPKTEDDAGPNSTDLPPFWMAVRTSSMGVDPDGGVPGFDLDGVCTCDGDPGSAFDAGPSCKPRNGANVACDDSD